MAFGVRVEGYLKRKSLKCIRATVFHKKSPAMRGFSIFVRLRLFMDLPS